MKQSLIYMILFASVLSAMPLDAAAQDVCPEGEVIEVDLGLASRRNT